MKFNSTILILPGLGNSGDAHWQTLWQKKFPEFKRVNQKEWDTPVCNDWIRTIDSAVKEYSPGNVILVGHSLACSTIAFWAEHFKTKIKAALLVAPSDTEAETYPPGTKGFKPIPLNQLPFRTIVVMSSDDYYVTSERASLFANKWGSELVNIGKAGHINVASGYGEWEEGLALIKRLDETE